MESRAFRPEERGIPTEFGYEFVREIANGGYGYVYLLRTTRKEGHGQGYLAGKFVYRRVFGPAEDSASGAAYRRAFEGLQNFRSLSAESPYLLRICDVGQRHEEGYFCYMMELADDLELGQEIIASLYKPRTLKNELERHGQRRRLPAEECVRIAKALAEGLRILHEGGFTHRDVRPSNIIFVHNVPKLADIDLLAEHDATLTSFIPKDYAAPDGSHSRQADLYSFGKTLYEMCTGQPVQAYPSLPTDIRYWEDHRLLLKINQVIAKACARELRKRYDSASLLLDDLERIR